MNDHPTYSIFQELLISAKDEQFEAFIPCSERIVRAVTDMVILFPEENNLDEGGNSNSSTRCVKGFVRGCVNLVFTQPSAIPYGLAIRYAELLSNSRTGAWQNG